jgi:hypothetical protein
MSKLGHVFFALVGKFLGKYWVPKHIIIDLFETLAKNLQCLLQKYGLIKLIIFYVKDEVSSSNTMINIFKSMVNYESLGVEKVFKTHVLDMPSLRFVNMQLSMKKCA